ncbi:MAG: hypothetical protein OXJ52_05860, partial [Oligoflexia bacterium]|nr:hypothetical protein [Oligoflexia bacterium]
MSRLKESFLLISLSLPTLKALCLKWFLRVWILKGSVEVPLRNCVNPLNMDKIDYQGASTK